MKKPSIINFLCNRIMKILYIACGSGSDPTIGGSLARTIEVAKRISKSQSVFFLTTTGGKKAIGESFPDNLIFEIKTPLSDYNNNKNYFLKQFVSYFMVALKSIFILPRLPECHLLYTDSDGLWDIIPAFLYKIKYPSSKWVAMSHHIITLRTNGVIVFVFSMINIILQRFCLFFICNFSDAVFVLQTVTGNDIKKFLMKNGCKKQFYYVKNGVDISFIKKIPQQEKKYEACFFGALRPSKGLYDVVPVWKGVCRTNRKAKLLIVGGILEVYRNYLISEIMKNKLEENIYIRDYVPDRASAIELIKKCRVFISPSREEGWGITIMECLTCGLPGVVWDLPSYKQILNGGIIKINLFDKEKFAEATSRLLSEKDLFGRLEGETIDATEQYDWDKVAILDLEAFNKILKL